MRTTVPCRDLRNSERSSAALPIFAGSNYRSRFDDANAVFLPGRFLRRWNELDNLPAFFTGNPILQFFRTDSVCSITFATVTRAFFFKIHARLQNGDDFRSQGPAAVTPYGIWTCARGAGTQQSCLRIVILKPLMVPNLPAAFLANQKQ